MSLRLQKKSSRFLVRAFIAVSKVLENPTSKEQNIKFSNYKTSLKNELIKRGIETKTLIA